MARIVSLSSDCAKCGGLATHEVFNSGDASVGTFCWKHAQEKLAELEAAERPRRAG